MLGPEPIARDSPVLAELLRTRPCWVVDGDEVSAVPDSEREALLERLRACDVIVLRRRHERYWGPVCGFVREDGQLELRVTVELDHSPLEDGALSSWFTNGVEHCRFMAAWSATR